MGPSLKFDSAIKDAIFNQRNWGKLGKWGKRKWGKFSTKRNAKLFGGGVRGEFGKRLQNTIGNTNEYLKPTFTFKI